MLTAIVTVSAIIIFVACIVVFSSDSRQESYTPPSYEPPKKVLCCAKCNSTNVRWSQANKDGSPDLRYGSNYLVCKTCNHATRYHNK